jgi:small subunit ribosomal protein S1
VNEILTAGDSVEAQVLAVKEDEKGNPKVSLSLKALLPVPEGFTPPAARSANAPVKFTIHQVVEGAVVRVETYGLFVQVDGTDGRQGRGLVPAGETGTQRGADLKKLFPEGTKVTCSVMETGDGKLKLSIRGAKNAAERADYESHKGQMAQKGFGTLADLLSKVKVKK